MRTLLLLFGIASGLLNYTGYQELQRLWQFEKYAKAAAQRQAIKSAASCKAKRAIAAIPVLGIGAAVAFETLDYQEYKREHPDATPESYAEEIAAVYPEIYAELKASVKDAVW